MKARIKQSQLDIYWYANHIGKEFDVVEFDQYHFCLIGGGGVMLKTDCEVIEEPKQIIDLNGIQTEPYSFEEKKVIAVEKDIIKNEIFNEILSKFKVAKDLERIAMLEILEEMGYPQTDMCKLFRRMADET